MTSAASSDNGTEFTSNVVLAWREATGIAWRYIAPRKPMQNAFCESFENLWRLDIGYRPLCEARTCKAQDPPDLDQSRFCNLFALVFSDQLV